jgi:apolipoprotein D and lipocalin family protein
MAPPAREGYRDPSAPIGVTSRFDADRMAGAWVVRGRMPPDAALGTVSFVALDATPIMETIDASGTEPRKTVWHGEQRQPGRYEFVTDDGSSRRDVVVIWVDEGHRTAAIGDPAGRFAWVLDRQPAGGTDRIRAARQILEFNGFDLGEMRMRP